MKCFWHTCMALVATAMMSCAANAQEIGSYQSILARAGYSQGNVSIANPTQMSVPSPSGAACNSGCATGHTTGMYGGYGGGNMYGGNAHGGSFGGGAAYGGNFGGGNAYGGSSYGGMYNGSTAYGGGIAGGQINGGMVGGQMKGVVPGQMGGSVNGGFANGGMVSGGAVNDGVAINGGMMNSGAVYGGNVVSGGYVGGPVVSAPSYCTNYTDYGVNNYTAAPVYVAGNAGIQDQFAGMGKQRNLVLGVFGVVLRRDYGDRRVLATDGAGGNFITNRGIEHGRMSGVGASLASRGCNGGGWETSYWGLDEEDDRTYFAPIVSELTGLDQLTHVPSGLDVYTIFNGANNVRIYRDTDIHNFEFNLLRNGGQYSTRTGKSATFELTGGFRLFKFDESFRYVSNSDLATYPTSPLSMEYNVEAENTLVGFQVGGRSEICLSQRLRMNYGGQVGLFNNHIETRQRIFDETGSVARVNSRDFDYSAAEDDASMLGQFDIGLIYQLGQSARIRVGYRALGVAGVALAADQIPYRFNDEFRNSSAQSNGDLLLHGVTFGTEFCF